MKKILLATDGSATSESAARFLARLPHDEKIELTVVSVLYVPGTERTYLVGDWYEKCLAKERERTDEALERIQTLFEGANVAIKTIVREGHPGETIVELAREVEPELLVIGAIGHSAIARAMLGSISDYVATHAPCSVLVVRPNERTDQNHQLRIAIGFEESGPAQAAIQEFAEFGWAGETDVRVVSITEQPGYYNLPYDGPSPDFLVEAAESIRGVAPNAVGELIHCSHVGEALVSYVESNQIDLIVMGETPRLRLTRILMGSVTRFVLRHASCSVWITRNRLIQETRES